jgi:hypothetical protein
VYDRIVSLLIFSLKLTHFGHILDGLRHSFEHLDLFYGEDFQPPLCSNFDESKTVICPEQNFCDKNFQPFPCSPCYSAIDTVGSFPPKSFPCGAELFSTYGLLQGFSVSHTRPTNLGLGAKLFLSAWFDLFIQPGQNHLIHFHWLQ